MLVASVPELAEAIPVQIEITEELNQHTWCVIQVRQTMDRYIAAETFLGKPVQVIARSRDQGERVVFEGFVLASDLQFELYGSYAVQITAVSASYRLDVAPHRAYFTEATDVSVLRELAAASGLSLEASIASGTARSYHQSGETDFAFMRRLADDAGAWVRPSEKGLEVHNRFQPGAKVKWREEQQLLSFSISGRLHPVAFDGAHYDPEAMRSRAFQQVKGAPAFFGSAPEWVSAVKSSGAEHLPHGYLWDRNRSETLQDFEKKLEKESKRAQGAGVVATGTSRVISIRCGDEVQVEGLPHAAGTYGVLRVKHTWTPSLGYHNEFQATPCKQWTSPVRPAIPHFSGVVPARVVDNNDPDGCGRVKVQFFWQGSGMTEWLPAMSPSASPDSGFLFVPEIGDEVWVAFEEGDLERGRILGSAWNGVQKAPWQEVRKGDLPANNAKWIRTKAGNYLAMSDKPDGNEVDLGTPASQIRLIDNAEQANGEPVLIIESKGHILLRAGGRIHMQSEYSSREVGDLDLWQEPSGARITPPVIDSAPEPPAVLGSQAAVLLRAAEAGTPLCERCE